MINASEAIELLPDGRYASRSSFAVSTSVNQRLKSQLRVWYDSDLYGVVSARFDLYLVFVWRSVISI